MYIRKLAPGVEIDGFSVVKSNMILYREVINDANVGPWCIYHPDSMDMTPAQTKEELERHLTDNSNGIVELTPGGWDDHLWDWGPRDQFWIPNEKDLKGIEEIEGPVWKPKIKQRYYRCINALGISELTKGKIYQPKNWKDDMLLILNDDGDLVEYLTERFEAVNDYE
jgi:hypothetical protein